MRLPMASCICDDTIPRFVSFKRCDSRYGWKFFSETKNHQNWKPIGEPEFNGFLEQQIGELDEAEKAAFEAFRVSPWKAGIRRTDVAGDEWVYVVLQKEAGVLYFDDVEFGFNIAGVDEHGGILNPGGSQFSLKEAIRFWILE